MRWLLRWSWVLDLIVAIIVADQLSKAWIERTIPLGSGYAPIPALDPYFMLVHWGNTGAAFGLLQGFGGLFAMLALIVIIVVLMLAHQLPLEHWGVRASIGLVLGGAIGNLIDRVRIGHVTDFLLFQVPIGDRMYQWPAFNIADSSIVVGVILLGLLLLRLERPEPAVET
ncbi:MAG: signal peptidase II [Anaerolineae bacterium]